MSQIKIANTLNRQKEPFEPIKAPTVNMYTCGVTVYDHCHIGHARSLYVFEVIRRYLRYRGYQVNLVRNITDVDDKIINRAREWAKEQDISLEDAFEKVRTTYIDSYYEDLDLLGIPKADSEPKATENIKEMQEYIEKLIAKGFAYQSGGNVYFSVRKLTQYGKLSGKKIDDLLDSVRIEKDSHKEDPLDFALWKEVKEDEPAWQSPWGAGRPGWHIECSVMSQKYLKADTLDIHGGGLDLIFPHHENEVAQSEALTGKPFAKYWIHHGLLTINNQKMAKSLGNFFTVKDVLKKYPADILKLFYLGAHYSSSIDFSWDKMEETKRAYERIMILKGKIDKKGTGERVPGAGEDIKEIQALREEFISAMDDDFNTAKALAVVFDLVNQTNKNIEDIRFVSAASALLREWMKIFNLTTIAVEHVKISAHVSVLGHDSVMITDKAIEEKIALRAQYKKDKKYKESDQIREDLLKQGIILEDGKDGKTTWRRKI